MANDPVDYPVTPYPLRNRYAFTFSYAYDPFGLNPHPANEKTGLFLNRDVWLEIAAKSMTEAIRDMTYAIGREWISVESLSTFCQFLYTGCAGEVIFRDDQLIFRKLNKPRWVKSFNINDPPSDRVEKAPAPLLRLFDFK